MQKSTSRPLAAGLTVMGALLRVIPHPMNFAPVGSVSLFGGARLRGQPQRICEELDEVVAGDEAHDHRNGECSSAFDERPAQILEVIEEGLYRAALHAIRG